MRLARIRAGPDGPHGARAMREPPRRQRIDGTSQLAPLRSEVVLQPGWSGAVRNARNESLALCGRDGLMP
jgi:hypothetical protein